MSHAGFKAPIDDGQSSQVESGVSAHQQEDPAGNRKDGAKDEPAVIEIVGEGPATNTPAEQK